MPLDDYHIPLECELPPSFNMNCDKYLRTFNKLMSARSNAFNYHEKNPTKSFRTLVCSRKVEFLAHWVFAYSKGASTTHICINGFKPKDLQANTSREGVFDAEKGL